MPTLPIGTIMPFAGDVSQAAQQQLLLSAGWMPCTGQSVAVATYPDLYNAIGNLYGGDGTTNISLPDLRGRFARGAGVQHVVATVLVAQTSLPATGGFTVDSAGAHTHTITNLPAWSNLSDQVEGYNNATWNSGNGSTDGPDGSTTHTHTLTGGGDSESRPVNIYVDYIIKVLDVTSP